MNPEPSQLQCAACEEPEPPFILTVIKDNVFRRLCADCLLKEHRGLFCPVCLAVYVAPPPPDAVNICLLCSSTTHLNCSSSSSDDHFFTCPPCLDPNNFSFFPKSLDNDGSGTVLDLQKAKALVAAAEIAVASAKNAAAQLEEEAVNKSIESKDAKEKAKEALEYLEDVKDKASGKKINPRKRKNSDR
ncbi:unnamed protein product [Brassica oleracea]